MWSRRQFLAASAALAQPSRPNIVFLISDDHHFRALGAAGNPYIETPNLDKLASRGVLYTHGIVSTPQCAPSRGILLSGLETYQSGLRSNGYTKFNPGFPPTVVEQLRRAGYATHLIGKWHIDNLPAECGFSSAPLWLRGGGSKYIDPSLRRGLDGKDETVPGHITELFTDAALDVVRKASGPYLLWLAYNAPHTPWTARDADRPRNPQPPPGHPKDAKPFDWSTYYAVIRHLDAQCGRVVDAIEKAGQWNNTLVVFLGDNGYLSGVRGLNGKVHPWAESVRVPYIVSGGVVKTKGKRNTPVASIDLPATFLDFAGIKPAYKLAGESLKSELLTGRSTREHAFATWDDPRPEGLATRQPVEPYRLVRTKFYTYIRWQSGREALYETANEYKDLAKSHPEVLAEMKGALAERMEATNDPARRW